MSEVIIVGAGLAGLCCALRLQEAGRDYLLVEASDEVGGRVRTDEAEGFLFDRGFQVLLTSYPEVKRFLPLERVQLKTFEPGALVYRFGGFHRLADPWRQPSKIMPSLLSSLGTVGDKWRIARLRSRLTWPALETILNRPEQTTREALEAEGFSDDMLASFFEPFMRGVFLDPGLTTSSRKFDYVFRMFSTGLAALPEGGMGKLPEALAGLIPPDRIRLSTPVEAIGGGRVQFANGEREEARMIVIAADPAAAARLLKRPPPRFQSCTTLYYSIAQSPVKEPILVLDGERSGPVNHLAVLTDVSPAYAPRGESLMSLTVLGNDARSDRDLDEAVRLQMIGWYGMAVTDWRLRRVYRLPEALPDQSPPALSPVRKSPRIDSGLYACGDYLNVASINGAMESGRLAAESILRDLGLDLDETTTAPA